MTATANDRGYLFTASDGGIFTYGNAKFHGSAAGKSTAPVVGVALDRATGGYWQTASDGGVFTFWATPLSAH
jgi:hypothetical protein